MVLDFLLVPIISVLLTLLVISVYKDCKRNDKK